MRTPGTAGTWSFLLCQCHIGESPDEVLLMFERKHSDDRLAVEARLQARPNETSLVETTTTAATKSILDAKCWHRSISARTRKCKHRSTRRRPVLESDSHMRSLEINMWPPTGWGYWYTSGWILLVLLLEDITICRPCWVLLVDPFTGITAWSHLINSICVAQIDRTLQRKNSIIWRMRATVNKRRLPKTPSIHLSWWRRRQDNSTYHAKHEMPNKPYHRWMCLTQIVCVMRTPRSARTWSFLLCQSHIWESPDDGTTDIWTRSIMMKDDSGTTMSPLPTPMYSVDCGLTTVKD
jgi:hypothetical protein